MNTQLSRDGFIESTDYWDSPECRAGTPCLLVHENLWHLLHPELVSSYITQTRRAFIMPVTKPRRRREGWWRWKLEIETHAPLHIDRENILGIPPPLPKPGTHDRNHHLQLYVKISDRDNTARAGQMALTVHRPRLVRN